MDPAQLAAQQHYLRQIYPRTTVARFFALGPRYLQFSRLEHAGYIQYSPANPSARFPPLVATMLRHGWSSVHLHAAQAPLARAEPAVDAHLEFQVDLDLADYDTVRRPGLRFCGCPAPGGTGKRACADCWLLVILARDTLRALLTEYLGLGEPLCVFSGSKGCHFWFGNATARHLTAHQRQALVAEFKRWRDAGAADISPVAAAGAQQAWARYAVADAPEGRGILLHDKVCAWLASFSPDTPLAGMQRLPTSAARWAYFQQHAGAAAARRVALEAALPVVDLALYASHHTLRLPFSVHTAPPHRLTLPLAREDFLTCNPVDMPDASGVGGGGPAAALWARSCAAIVAWLNACEYP